jgi:hypothetical protein
LSWARVAQDADTSSSQRLEARFTIEWPKDSVDVVYCTVMRRDGDGHVIPSDPTSYYGLRVQQPDGTIAQNKTMGDIAIYKPTNVNIASQTVSFDTTAPLDADSHAYFEFHTAGVGSVVIRDVSLIEFPDPPLMSRPLLCEGADQALNFNFATDGPPDSTWTTHGISTNSEGVVIPPNGWIETTIDVLVGNEVRIGFHQGVSSTGLRVKVSFNNGGETIYHSSAALIGGIARYESAFSCTATGPKMTVRWFPLDSNNPDVSGLPPSTAKGVLAAGEICTTKLGTCPVGQTKLSFDSFQTDPGEWIGIGNPPSANISNNTLAMPPRTIIKHYYDNLRSGTITIIFDAEGPGTLDLNFLGTDYSFAHQLDIPGGQGLQEVSISGIIPSSGRLLILFGNQASSPGDVKVANMNVCYGEDNNCDGSVAGIQSAIQWRGVTRQPVNIFNMVARITFRDTADPSIKTVVNLIPTADGRLSLPTPAGCAGPGSVDYWKQQGNSGTTETSITSAGLVPLNLPSITPGLISDISTKKNWLWSIPANSAGIIQDNLVTTWPDPTKSLVESVQFLFLTNRIDFTGGLTSGSPSVVTPTAAINITGFTITGLHASNSSTAAAAVEYQLPALALLPTQPPYSAIWLDLVYSVVPLPIPTGGLVVKFVVDGVEYVANSITNGGVSFGAAFTIAGGIIPTPTTSLAVRIYTSGIMITITSALVRLYGGTAIANVCPGPFISDPDPATEFDFIFSYVNSLGLQRSFSKIFSVNNLRAQSAAYAPPTWDTISALGNGVKGTTARWEEATFVLDAVDGSGLDQCTAPTVFKSTGSGTIVFSEFAIKGSGVSQDACQARIMLEMVQQGSATTHTKQKYKVYLAHGGYYKFNVIIAGVQYSTPPIPWNADIDGIEFAFQAIPPLRANGAVVVSEARPGASLDVVAAYEVLIHKKFGNVPLMTAESHLVCEQVNADPVPAPPYEYPLQDCPALPAGCSPAPFICRPLPTGEWPVEGPCCETETIRDSANIYSEVILQRDLFNPAYRKNSGGQFGDILTIKDMVVLKGLNPKDFTAYLRNFATGEFTLVAMTEQVQTKMSVVLLETVIDTEPMRIRLMQKLRAGRGVLPARMVWENLPKS